MRVIDLCKQQENEIERLNNIINEVREYIKNNTWEDEYGGDIIEDYNHKLLDILKKSNNLQSKIDKANKILDKYAKTEVEDYNKIVKFYKELRDILKEDK